MREDLCRLYEPGLAALEELEELALDTEEVAAAQAHLTGCSRCQARRRMWTRLDGALRDALAPTAATPTLTTADLLMAIGADHEPSERRAPMLSVITVRDEDFMDGDETRVTTEVGTGEAANETDGANGASQTKAGAPERHFAPLPSLATARRQPGWRRALMGGAAVAAVVALMAGITGVMSLTGRLSGTRSASHAKATAAAATQTAQVGPFVSQPPRVAGMAFDSSTDGWVVMEEMSGNSSNSWLYHYANGKYTQTATPASWGLYDAQLWSFAPDNLWVFAGAGGSVYHYDGHGWTQQTFPAPRDAESPSTPSVMTMVSPTQGWAVGNTFVGPVGAQTLIQVFYHYDGSTWRIDPADSQASKGAPSGSPTPTPQGDQAIYSGNDQIQLTAISATPGGDVWATGYLQIQDENGNISSTTGYLYHRANGVWRVAQVMRNTELDGILMTGANSGWITGRTITSKKVITTVPITTTRVTPIVLSWDGARWSQAAIPQPDQTQSGMTFTQIAADSPSNVWIIGSSNGMTVNTGPYAGDNTYLIHFDGARWSHVSLPQVAAINPSHDISITNQVAFNNLAAAPSGDLWLAGGLSVNGGGSGNYQWYSLLYRYSGGQWVNVQLPALPASGGAPASGSQPAG